jgi:hypothetical protein
VFSLPNSPIFDITEKINFKKKLNLLEFKEVTIGSWSYLVENQPQKIAALFNP